MKNIRIWVRCGLAALIFAFAIQVQAQAYGDMYDFGSVEKDAAFPQYGIIAQGRDGSLYSTTPYGGTAGVGTVFKVSAGQVTVLHNFDSTDGEYPFSGLSLGVDGNLYGTNYAGGSDFSGGNIFKITPSGKLTVLHTFVLGEGFTTFAPPVPGPDGNLYGTTSNGGINGYGTVYKISSSGHFKTIYSFDYTNGNHPLSSLVAGADGNFYGTAWQGGDTGGGTVFRVSTKGKITKLHSFEWYTGIYPYSGLELGSDGNFYGTSNQGGDFGYGTVFKISAKGKYSVLHSFSPAEGGPIGGMVLGSDGRFYGTTYGEPGILYRIKPNGAFTVVHNFEAATGFHPETAMMQHTSGMLYGDTTNGGLYGYGTFFYLDAAVPSFIVPVPVSAKVGQTVGILGQGLTETTAVSFNGTAAQFGVSSDTFLTATLPDGATTGRLTVTTTEGTLASKRDFWVIPTVQSFTPTSGPVGTVVTITGVSLAQTKRVSFGGRSATFNVNNDKQVTATVPAGAKTGKIVITTAGGSATSPGVFTVTP